MIFGIRRIGNRFVGNITSKKVTKIKDYCMKEVLLKIIEKIQRERALNKQHPNHVLFVRDILFPLRVEAVEVLKELEREGKISHTRTINDEAYLINESDQ